MRVLFEVSWTRPQRHLFDVTMTVNGIEPSREVLEIQMDRTDKAYLRMLKRRAFINGLCLCGMSMHQGFVTPDEEKRRWNVEKTIASIELAELQ